MIVDIKNTAESWIRLQYAKTGSDTYEENFWASEELLNLCDNSPEQRLAVINQITLIDTSDFLLSNLAAGPVEDLLVAHGEQVISSIMQLARRRAVWKKILGAVWRNKIADHVWQQIKSIADPSW